MRTIVLAFSLGAGCTGPTAAECETQTVAYCEALAGCRTLEAVPVRPAGDTWCRPSDAAIELLSCRVEDDGCPSEPVVAHPAQDPGAVYLLTEGCLPPDWVVADRATPPTCAD